jgi:alanyl-tRNA synthetase
MEVCIKEMKIDDARKKGAMALFGEKYGDDVRTVSVEDFSMELCGGTHVSRTGDIGYFKIKSESSIASGTRRIEAVAGSAAEKYVRDLEYAVSDAAYKLKGNASSLVERVDKMIAQQKEMEKEIKKLKSQLVTVGGAGAGDADKSVKKIDGVNVLLNKVSGIDIKSLREVSDKMKTKLKSGIVILANADKDKLSFIVNVSKDLVASGYDAGKIARNIAKEVNGSGGGKPDFAQGGGKDVSKFDNVENNLAGLIK